MAYNENLPADTTAPTEIRENFRALKNDKIVAAASAVTATKLEIARRISISGDASGSAEFDGSEDVSISLDVTNIIAKAMPVGGIIMWSGSETSIPEKWHLCDGTNGTPNLQGRFIVGVGTYVDSNGSATYSNGSIGGERLHQLNTDEMPSHKHQSGYMVVGDIADYFPFGLGSTHTNRYTAGTNGPSISSMTDSVGSNQPHNNLPPYYALAYIMKIA